MKHVLTLIFGLGALARRRTAAASNKRNFLVTVIESHRLPTVGQVAVRY
jgi:hypothetical protein